MNYYNQVNELLCEMTDDINYITKVSFLHSLKK